MGKYSQIRDLNDGKTRVRDFYATAVGYFSKEFSIPRGDFPKLRFVSGEHMAYDQVNNQVTVGDEEFVSVIGDSLGEELGHYVRARLMGRVGNEVEEKEAHSDEFYGFLGSKVLFRASDEKERESFFPDGERTFESNYEGKNHSEKRKELLRNAKNKGFSKLKKRYKDAESRGDTDEMKKVGDAAARHGYGEHVKSLMHVRPYHFSSKINLDKVGDLREFYSLSDKSVRQQFFRENRSLEGRVVSSTIAIVGLMGGLSFLSSNMTGFTISSIGYNSNSLLGVIFLVLGLLGSYSFLKNK